MGDIILCYVIPCFIVVVLNTLILSKVMSAKKSFLSEMPSQPYLNLSTAKTKLTTSSFTNTSIVSKETGKRVKRTLIPSSTHLNSANNNTSSSTRILLVLPVVYILLNTPFYLIRLADTIALNMFNSTEFSIQGGLNNKQIRWLNNGAHYLYYGNFSCDVLVYAFSRYFFEIVYKLFFFFSSTFRRSVCHVWCRLLCPKWTSISDRFESTSRRSCKIIRSTTKNKIPSTQSTAVKLLEKYSTTDSVATNPNNPGENTTIYYKNNHNNSSISF